MQLGAMIAGLSRPDAYPHPVAHVEVLQTHASVVFRTERDVYKIKKPVDFGFLDYSTLAKRKRMCEAEVELNRRLAPAVYLGVVPITEVASHLCFGGGTKPVEWAVHMVRLPDDATLDARLEAGTATEHDMRRLAVELAGFHRRAKRGPEVTRWARFEVVQENCWDNLIALQQHVGLVVGQVALERLHRLTERELARQRESIERRAAADVACETHGDLRPEHVYFLPDRQPPDDLAIIDCVEFSERFRHADPVSDLAFLAMGLHARAARGLADVLADTYFAVADDLPGRGLLPLYTAYRATVRAKVDTMKSLEDEVGETDRQRALQSARSHVLVALGELAPAIERPCLVLVMGLPGSGKSTLAEQLAAKAGFRWVRSDSVRKRLAGIADTDRAGEEFYGADWSDRTYQECLRLAESGLFAGERVLIDATFRSAARRRPFLDLARRWCVPVVELVCESDEQVTRARLQARTHDPSDAGWETYLRLRPQWEAATPEEVPMQGRIDASDEVEQTVRRALDWLGRAHLA